MKILIISYNYLPALNPRSFRWSSLANQFVDNADTVDVVSSVNFSTTKEEVINGVNVYRVGFYFFSKLKNKLSNSGRVVTSKSNRIGIGYFVKKLIRGLYNMVWRSIYWPDYACLWIIPAFFKSFKLCMKNKYDAVITVSHPFSSHVAGYLLSKVYKGKKWMLDVGDPFCYLELTPTNNHKIYGRFNYYFERKIFSKSDVISVTTDKTGAKYKEVFPECGNKIYVIPPLFSLKHKKEGQEKSVFSKNNKKKLVYIGTLYKNIRSPQMLLDVFDMLNTDNSLELHFLGDLHDCEDLLIPYSDKINSSIFLHGVLDRSLAYSAICNADILVNIGNDTSYQLPSKIIEYMSTGRPVLNFVKSMEDSSVDILQEYPSRLNIISGPVESINTREIQNFILKSVSVDNSIVSNLLKKFSSESIFKSYLCLLNKESSL